MERILLLTDFSKNARRAIDYALLSFSGRPCSFLILNVQKSSEYITDDLMTAKPGESLHQSIAADNKKLLNRLADELRETYKAEDYEFETVFDYDNLVAAIEQIASTRQIDLVVMGTNGANSAEEKLFGSNTLRVIRNTELPVLAIPERFELKSIDHLLITVVDDHYPSETTLIALNRFVSRFKPTVHFLEIQTVPNSEGNKEESKKAIFKMFELNGIEKHLITNVPAPMAIHAFNQLHDMDLHAVTVLRRSFLDRFIHGSPYAKISYESPIPLFVMH